ncbi:MAG: hypothetical protein HY690_18450 [Chloroflexi bacterium]|nr:hypothetical protein [Chloroflexota bacterium]
MSANKETANRVPRVKSLEEEATFWDTHSPLDYPKHWKEGKRAKGQRPLGHILGVRLDAEVIGELAAIARDKGLGPSTLARMWIMERLLEERREKPRQKESGEAPASRGAAVTSQPAAQRSDDSWVEQAQQNPP